MQGPSWEKAARSATSRRSPDHQGQDTIEDNFSAFLDSEMIELASKTWVSRPRQRLEEPILKGLRSVTPVRRIDYVHPTVNGAKQHHVSSVALRQNRSLEKCTRWKACKQLEEAQLELQKSCNYISATFLLYVDWGRTLVTFKRESIAPSKQRSENGSGPVILRA